MIDRLRVLVDVVPLAPLRPTATATAAAATAVATTAAATPNPKRLARFTSTLLALSPLFSRLSGLSAPPSPFSILLQPLYARSGRCLHPARAASFVARMSTMPLAAIYPNRANAQPTPPWLSSDRPSHCYTVCAPRCPVYSPFSPPPRVRVHVTPPMLAVNVRRVTTLDPEGKGIATARYIFG